VSSIRVLCWDVGGVLATNAWDHDERDLAIQRFHLDKPEFETRHKEVVSGFEEGRMTLEQYLQQTVFYQPRTFSSEEFKRFMFTLSKPKSDVLEFARSLSRKYLMATINNESRELNQYRIQTFALAEIFDLFVSSCFVGLRKPDERIYRLALDLTQLTASQCCFIDDRAVNVESATKVGMRGIQLQDLSQLKRELQKNGLEI
jgi:putative hydrolase of the HAD superfamily